MKRTLKTRLISMLLLLCMFIGLLPSGAFAANKTEERTTRAVSVPSISAPFTTHPTVFIVEDTYQIAFATDATGIAWVEVGGVKYEDARNGLLNWNSKYHKITVPQSALNSAGSYKICFRSLADRAPVTPVPGTTVSRTYPFTAAPTDRNPVFYCSADQHGSNDYDLAISEYKAFDVYVFDGDYVGTLMEDEELKLLLDMTGSVTQGCKPTIYARGNHEIRGAMSHELHRVSGYSETTGAYYRVELPGIFALVMDAGEDKEDTHADYAGTVDFDTYRKEQTEWLRQIVAEREWEKYPVRMVFCHVPFSLSTRTALKPVYAEWTELLDQMGISLVVSGHTHDQAFYEPSSTSNKSDPNFTTVVVSDRENGTDIYSGAFITVSNSQYTVEIIRQDKTVKATKTIPTFTNAYVGDSASEPLPLSQSVEATPNSVQSVPAVASPYTMHPSVFAVEDGYEIIFNTDATGMAWVEVAGKKYTDATTGMMDWASKYHQVYVPADALDAARSYTLCFQSMETRKAYKPVHGDTVSCTYPFTPMGDKAEPVLLALSDMRKLNAEARSVATYQSFDALYIGGDYVLNGDTEEDIKVMLSDCATIANGTKPIIYTRGNRELRGAAAYLLEEAAPSTKSGKSYYTIEQNNLFAIVLDTGEDKVDSHSEYGGTVAFEKYRDEQTQWLREVLASGKWKDYPTRVAFCHVPITLYAYNTGSTSGLKAAYTEWTELLGQMGISLMISGNKYTHEIYPENSSSHYIDPSFAVVTVSDVDNTTYAYSGSYITIGQSSFKIENVSAAKNLLKTSTVSNLTSNNYWENSDQHLMFDFNNDSVAQERYHSSVYGGINYDLGTNWTAETNTAAPAITSGVLSFSPASATVTSSGLYSRIQGTSDGQWGYRQLHYIPKTTDYFQVRFKIDNAVSSATNGQGIFRLDLECPNDINDAAKYYTRYEKSFAVADIVGNGYTTLTFPLNSTEYMKFDWLNSLHPQFVNIKSASDATATFSIDYIYIGPQATLPKQDDHIFIDFTDTEEDRQRYDSLTYNHLNYDDPTNWMAYNGSPLVSISDGAMRLAVTDGNTDSNFSVRGGVMHYVPGDNDYLQVRVKIEDAVATAADGIANFQMVLECPNNTTQTTLSMNFNVEERVGKGWFVLKTPLASAEYLASDWINLLHPQFAAMKSESGKTAAFYIDYIYIGPEKNLLGSDPLLFDFTAKDDYSGKQYGSLDYNVENVWGATAGLTDTIDIDTTTGTLTLSRPDANGYNYFYVQTWTTDKGIARYPLTFDPENAEYLQLRMKISGFDAATKDTRFCLNYYVDATAGSTQYTDAASYSFGAGYEFDGTYITLKLKLNDAFRNAESINGIKLNFWNLNGTGTVVFDYIYIGPESDLPGQEPLYFDFKNDTSATERYSSDTYGGDINFDTVSNWVGTFISSGVYDSISANNSLGTMTLSKTSANTKTWSYLRNEKYLRYRPENAEYLQVRLSLSGFAAAGNDTRFEMLYYTNGNSTQYADGAVYKFEKGFIFEGEYLTLTLPISEAFRQNEIISQIKMNFWNLQGTGTVTFDYIYIGTKKGLPDQNYLRFGYVTSENQAVIAQQDCLVTTGVTESTLKLNDEAKGNPAVGFLTTIEPDAQVTFKASYSGYYTAGSTAQSRAQLIPTLPWALERTTSQAAAYEAATGGKVLLATNADFYDVDTYQPLGYLVMEGNVLQTYGSRQQPFFAVLKDGSFAIRDFGETIADVEEAVSGVWLVKDGKNVTDTYVHAQSYRDNNPMNAIGVTADGTVYIFVIDGRQASYSMGMDANDLSNLFVSLGCVSAIDLDGGGSATYASVHEGATNLRLRNIPSDSTGERAIADALLLVSTAGQCQHDYSKNYVNNNDGTHTVSCQKCSSQITSAHHYVNGKCVCGAVEEEPNYLYFEFTNDAAARERYNNFVYGYWNFDQPKGNPWPNPNWATVNNNSLRNSYQVDNTMGVLTLDVTNDSDSRLLAPTKAYKNFPWYNEAGSNVYPLSYTPKDAEYFQIRFKTENCTAVTGRATQIKVHYHYDNDGACGRIIDTPKTITLKNGTYQILTIAVPQGVRDVDLLTTFLVEFLGVTSAEGSISVDYIYVGSKAKLPTALHTVTFADESGNVLQTQTVHQGESAVYTGTTPTKAPDSTNHYTFAHWDQSSENVTSDMTITAQFTAEEHSFSYRYVDESKHLASCDCGYSVEQTHTELIDEGFDATCTETGLTEGKHCSVCNEILVACGILDALGHSYLYTDKGENHAVTCENCDYSVEEDHSYVEGSCICGAVESTDPIPDPSLKFNMDIVAGAEMVVNYNFMAMVVSKYTDFYLEVSKEVAGGEPIVTTFGVSEGHIPMGSMNHPATGAPLMYNAAYNGINAKEMGDSFATTLYAIDANGKIYKGETVVRSIEDYLLGKLEDENSIPELKTMAVDMLKYGAAAQVNFNYDVENLVTNVLTEEQLALATQEIPEASDDASVTGTGASISTSITVNSKVELTLSCISAGQANPAGVKCVITDSEGKTLAELPTTNLAGVMYSAKYDNVGAKEMRNVITATFYNEAGEAISQTVRWSVESYVAQTRARTTATETEIAMVNAMLIYGDSVAAYLTSTGQ